MLFKGAISARRPYLNDSNGTTRARADSTHMICRMFRLRRYLNKRVSQSLFESKCVDGTFPYLLRLRLLRLHHARWHRGCRCDIAYLECAPAANCHAPGPAHCVSPRQTLESCHGAAGLDRAHHHAVNDVPSHKIRCRY